MSANRKEEQPPRSLPRQAVRGRDTPLEKDPDTESATKSRAKGEPILSGLGSFFGWLARYSAFGALVVAAHLAALLGALYLHRSKHVPPTPTTRAAHSSAQALTRIYAGDGQLIGEMAVHWRQWTP